MTNNDAPFDEDNVLAFLALVEGQSELSKRLTARARQRAKLLDDGTEAGALQAGIVRMLDLRRRSKLYAELFHQAEEHVHERIERLKADACDATIAELTAELDALGIRVSLKVRKPEDDVEGDTSKDTN